VAASNVAHVSSPPLLVVVGVITGVKVGVKLAGIVALSFTMARPPM
jgi:hypothetical protein